MFHFAVGKLPADCLCGYLPFSLMKVVRKIYSIDKFGFISFALSIALLTIVCYYIL
ncbi:MAG: hypothetical protein ACE14Q_08045 [Acidobacteriota bacterium]